MALVFVCTENKVLFLKGDESCSGLVGIEHGEKPYWLSGSEETWNKSLANIVCKQMHCGEAVNISRSPSENRPIWTGSFSCSPDQKSIFDCNKTEIRPSDHNQSIAYVKCKGNVEREQNYIWLFTAFVCCCDFWLTKKNVHFFRLLFRTATGHITVGLTSNCWGTVVISTLTTKGAVSELHWSEKLSKKLCEEQGCGTVLKPLGHANKSIPIIFKSLHATKQSSNISQYSIVKMEKSLETQDFNPAYVVCKGTVFFELNLSLKYFCWSILN